jgi:O-antigen/teichoic acid export membrane protein
MVSYLLGNAAAGLYQIVFQLSYIVVTASIAIGVAVLPAMSELAGRGEDTAAAYHRGTLLATALAIGAAVFFALAGPFILHFVYGLTFFEGYAALIMLSLFGAAASLLVPAVSLLTVHHRAGTLTLVSLAQAIINVPLGYVLTLRYGILGAASATTGVFVIGLIVTWWLAHHLTGSWPYSAQATREAWSAGRKKLGW